MLKMFIKLCNMCVWIVFMFYYVEEVFYVKDELIKFFED